MKVYEIYSETKKKTIHFNVLEASETNSMVNFICGGAKRKINKSTLNKFKITKDGFVYYTDSQFNFDMMLSVIKGTKDTSKEVKNKLKELKEEKQLLINKKREVESYIKDYSTYLTDLQTAKMMTDFRTKAKYEENDFSDILEKI